MRAQVIDPHSIVGNARSDIDFREHRLDPIDDLGKIVGVWAPLLRVLEDGFEEKRIPAQARGWPG